MLFRVSITIILLSLQISTVSDAVSQTLTYTGDARLVISGTKPMMLKPDTQTNITIYVSMFGLSDYSNISIQVDGDIVAMLSESPNSRGSFVAEVSVSTENIPIDDCLTFVAKAVINSKVLESDPCEVCVSSFNFMSPYGELGPILEDPESGFRYVADELIFKAKPKTKEEAILRIADSVDAEVASWNPYLNSYLLKLSKPAEGYTDLVKVKNRLLEHPEVVRSGLNSISSLH